ncbi:MAG TPA: hypothetical protein VMS93_01740 [Candidatus Saccharimonadales bacterium]|nr:hypothetical protein [Candidatus Saccharimonadales bacterium]
MNWRATSTAAPALLCVALGAGCLGSPAAPPAPVRYKAPTSPENVLFNLAALYQNLDPARYDSTLASGFVFRFHAGDISPGSPDTLGRADELAFAENFLRAGGPGGSPPAASLKLHIDALAPGPDPRAGHGGWLRCAAMTDLSVEFADGRKLALKGAAWFYFVREPAGGNTWKLAEWADGPPAAPGGATSSSRTAGSTSPRGSPGGRSAWPGGR